MHDYLVCQLPFDRDSAKFETESQHGWFQPVKTADGELGDGTVKSLNVRIAGFIKHESGGTATASLLSRRSSINDGSVRS